VRKTGAGDDGAVGGGEIFREAGEGRVDYCSAGCFEHFEHGGEGGEDGGVARGVGVEGENVGGDAEAGTFEAVEAAGGDVVGEGAVVGDGGGVLEVLVARGGLGMEMGR